MFNPEKLRCVMKAKGMGVTTLAKEIDITRGALHKKLKYTVEFNRREMGEIIRALNLSPQEVMKIFFWCEGEW